jgi:hypothetical protein
MYSLAICMVFYPRMKITFWDSNNFVVFNNKNNTQQDIINHDNNINCQNVLHDILESYEKTLSINKNNPKNIGKKFDLTQDQFTKINDNCNLVSIPKNIIYPTT